MNTSYSGNQQIYVPKNKPYPNRVHTGSFVDYLPIRKSNPKDPHQSRGSFEVPADKIKNHLFPDADKNNQEVPIPRGNSAYAKAKKAEYLEKNLAKAEKFYRIAIKNGERLESAIKDLATVLHQQGKTEEACKFLEDHRHLCKRNRAKYDNLLLNLKKQIVPSGNFLNRTLVLFNVPNNYDEERIKSLFNNTSRFNEIEFVYDNTVTGILNSYAKDDPPIIIISKACLIRFGSNSAARKSLETLKEPTTYQFYWMSVNGELMGKAEAFKKKEDDDEKLSQVSSEDSDGESDASDETSTQNTSFSFHGGALDSPSTSLPTTEIFRSPRVSLELTKEMDLSSTPRSRKSSDVSDGDSPCWNSCLLVFSKGELELETSPKDKSFYSFEEETKKNSRTPSKTEIQGESGKSPKPKDRRPSRFLESYAVENPGSWQARNLNILYTYHKAKSEDKGIGGGLWNKVRNKHRESKSMISEDPDFVQKLLLKMLNEDQSPNQKMGVTKVHSADQ